MLFLNANSRNTNSKLRSSQSPFTTGAHKTLFTAFHKGKVKTNTKTKKPHKPAFI